MSRFLLFSLPDDYFDELQSDVDSRTFSVGEDGAALTPDLLDRASIGTTYNDRFTPDLRSGLDDYSLGQRSPSPEPTTPVSKRNTIAVF